MKKVFLLLTASMSIFTATNVYANTQNEGTPTPTAKQCEEQQKKLEDYKYDKQMRIIDPAPWIRNLVTLTLDQTHYLNYSTMERYNKSETQHTITCEKFYSYGFTDHGLDVHGYNCHCGKVVTQGGVSQEPHAGTISHTCQRVPMSYNWS